MLQIVLLLVMVWGGLAEDKECQRGLLCQLPVGTNASVPETDLYTEEVMVMGMELPKGHYYYGSCLPNSTAPTIHFDRSHSLHVRVIANFYTNTTYDNLGPCWRDIKRPAWGVCFEAEGSYISLDNRQLYGIRRIAGLPGLTGVTDATVGNDSWSLNEMYTADPICTTEDQTLYVHVSTLGSFAMANQPSTPDVGVTGECKTSWRKCVEASVEDGCLALEPEGCSICAAPSIYWSQYEPTCTPTPSGKNSDWWQMGEFSSPCSLVPIVVPKGAGEITVESKSADQNLQLNIFQITLPKGHTFIMGGPKVKDSTRVSVHIGGNWMFDPYPAEPINFPPVPFSEDCCQNGWNGVAASNQAMTDSSIKSIGIGKGSRYNQGPYTQKWQWDPPYRHQWSIYSLPNMLSGIGDPFITEPPNNYSVYPAWISPGLPSENARGIQGSCFDKDTTWFIYAKFNQNNYPIYFNQSLKASQTQMVLHHSTVKVKDDSICTSTRQDCSKITTCGACKAANGCGWCTGADSKLAIKVNNHCFLRKGGWSNLSPDESWCKLAKGSWAGEDGATCRELTPKEKAALLTGRLPGSAGDLDNVWAIPTLTVLLGGIGAVAVFCGIRRRSQFKKYFGDIQRMREDLARQAEEKAAAKAAAEEAAANAEGPAEGTFSEG